MVGKQKLVDSSYVFHGSSNLTQNTAVYLTHMTIIRVNSVVFGILIELWKRKLNSLSASHGYGKPSCKPLRPLTYLNCKHSA